MPTERSILPTPRLRRDRTTTPSAAPRGFTLVELLVVIAVLAILAAVLGPNLTRARQLASRTACLSQLRQIGHAHTLYIGDWDQQFPAWRFPDPNALPWRDPSPLWTDYLQPYLRSGEILRDPSIRRREPPHWDDRSDYALLTLGPGGQGTWISPYWRGPGPPLAVTHVVRPSETLLLTDGITTTRGFMVSPLRHARGANFVFVDGHARWMRERQRREKVTDADGFTWQRYLAADR